MGILVQRLIFFMLRRVSVVGGIGGGPAIHLTKSKRFPLRFGGLATLRRRKSNYEVLAFALLLA